MVMETMDQAEQSASNSDESDIESEREDHLQVRSENSKGLLLTTRNMILDGSSNTPALMQSRVMFTTSFALLAPRTCHVSIWELVMSNATLREQNTRRWRW